MAGAKSKSGTAGILMLPPKIIGITSDGSEVEFVSSKDGFLTYRYTKGIEKVGSLIQYTESYLEEQLKNYFVVIEHGTSGSSGTSGGSNSSGTSGTSGTGATSKTKEKKGKQIGLF